MSALTLIKFKDKSMVVSGDISPRTKDRKEREKEGGGGECCQISRSDTSLITECY